MYYANYILRQYNLLLQICNVVFLGLNEYERFIEI
jgi:hypothetical protein